MSEPLRRLLQLGTEHSGSIVGAKAARLTQAMRAGLPVLPGWVVPVSEGRTALRAGASSVTSGNPASARRTVLRHWFDPDLAAELREATVRLGGRVIARSSSPLENDSRWSGAFSSVTGAGPDEAAVAVRSCWASAFAVDPLERLKSCGLPPEALELAVLLQPEISPDAGGIARVIAGEVRVEGVAGHPGPLLSGWAEGAAGEKLAELIGPRATNTVIRLAEHVHGALGDDTIEWAITGGQLWLLQSLRSARPPAYPNQPAPPLPRMAAPPAAQGPNPGFDPLLGRDSMPFLAEIVLTMGQHVPSQPAVPGTAAGRLVHCQPHERQPGTEDAILLVDRPVPALAPLLFGARGLIARTGAAASHLAEVARSLGVPMVTGCQPESVTGGGGSWLAAINGSTGDVALLPA